MSKEVKEQDYFVSKGRVVINKGAVISKREVNRALDMFAGKIPVTFYAEETTKAKKALKNTRN